MAANNSDSTGGINRRRLLGGLGTALAATGFFSGIASASDLQEVTFCGCSQVCFSGGNPSIYRVWIGYRDGDSWAYDYVSVRLAPGEGGTCYTVEEAESELGLDQGAEAKIIGISDFDSPLRYVGNPGRCARFPLQAFDEDPPSNFNGFINDAGGDALTLEYGTFRNTEITHGGCGSPDRPEQPGNSGNGQGRGQNAGNGRGPRQ